MKIFIVLLFFLFSVSAFTQDSSFRRDSLYRLLKLAPDPSGQVSVWGQISEDYAYTGQPDSSRYASEEMLKIAASTNQDSLLARAYLEIGSYFSITSDFKTAIEFEFKSLGLAEKAKSIHDIWLANKDLGVNFKHLKNYSEALRYLKKAESLLQEIHLTDPKAANRTYSHIAEVYAGSGQSDSALRYVQLTNEFTSKDKDPYGYARMLYIFANIHQQRGDTDLAESYYKKCIFFSSAENIYLPYVTAAIDYGQYLFNTRQYKLSKEYALNGFSKATNAKNKLEMINAASLLRKAYYAVGQKDSSYYYADIKDVYADSVFNEQQRHQIQNLSFTQQLNEIEEQARLSEEAEKRKENIQYLLISIGIIVLLSLYLILSRSFITNAKLIEFFGVVTLLIVFEFLNLALHPFLERITHHSLILILLAMVCIAALLAPIHHSIEKWATAKLIEKNKQIRLAAAKKTISQLEKKPGLL